MFKQNACLNIGGIDYRLIEFIAAGGQCVVWKAERLTDHRFVVLRTVNAYYRASSGELVARETEVIEQLIALLNAEIELLNQLDEQAAEVGILPLLAVGEYSHSDWKNIVFPIMVQPYCPGGSLRSFVRGQAGAETCHFTQWWNWFLRLMGILYYLHGKSPTKIHRDIKPDNLLRDDKSRLALIDFGLARVWQYDERSFVPAGSARYVAPEQFLASTYNPQGEPGFLKEPASDIYSSALVFIALIHGQIDAHRLFVTDRFVEKHRAALMRGEEGLLGEIGGISDAEFDVVLQSIKAVLGADSRLPLASQYDIAWAITDLLRRMLAPEIGKRPSAHTILLEEIPFIQQYLLQLSRQDRMKSFTIAQKQHIVEQGQGALLCLEVDGGGILNTGYDWLLVQYRGERLRFMAVDEQGVPLSGESMLRSGQHTLYFSIELPPAVGDYQLDISLPHTKLPTRQISCRHVVPFAELWAHGDYERALYYSFREPEFLEYMRQCERQKYEPKGIESFLSRLQEAHPDKPIISEYLQKWQRRRRPISLQPKLYWRIGIVMVLIGVSVATVSLLSGSPTGNTEHTEQAALSSVEHTDSGTPAEPSETVEEAALQTELVPDTEEASAPTALEPQQEAIASPDIERATNTLQQWNQTPNKVDANALQQSLLTLKTTAKEGSLEANLWLGYYYSKRRQNAEAILYYREAAEQGDKSAQIWVAAVVWHAATDGADSTIVQRYYHDARRYAQTLAEQGDPAGMYYFGNILHDIDYMESEGMQWIKQAAAQGYAAAQVRLGEAAN